MRTEYIKQVKKNLAISYKMKDEIIRDLNEIFDSAKEHGETEEQVISRLGSPADFAEECTMRLGNKLTFYRKNKIQIIWCSIVTFCSLICFSLVVLSLTTKLPNRVIGQADALTNISVISVFALNFSTALFIIGLILAVIAIVLIVRIIHKK